MKKNSLALLAFSTFVSLLQLYMVLSGRKAFRGGAYEVQVGASQGPTDPLIVLIDSLVPYVYLLLGLLGQPLTKAKKVNYFLLLLYGFVFLTQLLWLIILSSRSLIVIYAIISLFGFRLSLWGRFTSITGWFRKNFLILLALGFSVSFLIRFVYLLRFLANNDANLAKGSIFELFLTGLESFFTLGSNYELKSAVEASASENVGTRTFVMGVAASILEQAMDGKDPLWGREFVNNVLTALPSALIKNKSSIPTAEVIWSQNFSLYSNDIADSFYLSAIADFYWVGMIIYPVAVYFLIEFSCKVALSSKSGVLVTLTVSILLYICLCGGEGNFIGFLSGIRNVVIFLILIFGIKILLPKSIAAKVYAKIS